MKSKRPNPQRPPNLLPQPALQSRSRGGRAARGRQERLLPRLTSKQWWSASAIYAVVVAGLSLVPVGADVPAGWLDKPLHGFEYLVLAWCLVQTARASGIPHAKILPAAFLLSTGYGVFLEGVQGWLPYRSLEWMDLAANTVGAVVGLWLGMVTPSTYAES